MAPTFSKDFKRYQRQERILTSTIVLVAVFAPMSFTLLLQHKIHWVVSLFCAVALIVAAVWAHIYRDQVSKKVLKTYENLDVGAVLSKKISHKSPRKYVVVNRGYNHFYLQCLGTGEQVLVSKSKVREDFNITN